MSLEVANTILQQLGGRQFITMTGARDIFGSDKDNSLQFKIGRNSSKANVVIIKLMPSDTYNVEFWYTRVTGSKLLKIYEGVYDTNLQSVFTDYTGLHTSLGTMGSAAVVVPIPRGSTVRINHGAMHPQREGIVTGWEPHAGAFRYELMMEDGNVEYTDEIRNPGETTLNGSPIGVYLVARGTEL